MSSRILRWRGRWHSNRSRSRSNIWAAFKMAAKAKQIDRSVVLFILSNDYPRWCRNVHREALEAKWASLDSSLVEVEELEMVPGVSCSFILRKHFCAGPIEIPTSSATVWRTSALIARNRLSSLASGRIVATLRAVATLVANSPEELLQISEQCWVEWRKMTWDNGQITEASYTSRGLVIVIAESDFRRRIWLPSLKCTIIFHPAQFSYRHLKFN